MVNQFSLTKFHLRHDPSEISNFGAGARGEFNSWSDLSPVVQQALRASKVITQESLQVQFEYCSEVTAQYKQGSWIEVKFVNQLHKARFLRQLRA